METGEVAAAEWAALWERCPRATPFQHPAWLLPWWRHVWRGGRQWWMALRDGGRLAGVAPLFVWGEPRCVSLAGSGESDYLDLLVEPEHARAGAAMVLEYLARHRDRWDVCDLPDLRDDSPLPGAVPAGIAARVERCSACLVAPLPPTAEEWYDALCKRVRHNVRRAFNRVARAGGVLETASADNLEEWLAALFRLHAARWRERGEPGVLADGRMEAFHRDAARELLAAGLLRLYGLRMPEGPAAVHYGFAGHGRFYAYLDGFDPAYARLSPGTALIGRAIECAIAEGLAEFDFLRGPEGFKYEWGAADRTNRRLVLRHA